LIYLELPDPFRETPDTSKSKGVLVQNRQTTERAATAAAAAVVIRDPIGGVKGTEGGYVAMKDYLVNGVAKALAERGLSRSGSTTAKSCHETSA